MSRRITAWCGLCLLGLAACQPLPHPFETAHDLPEGRFMALPDVVGIAVDPVRGLPAATSDTVRAALAKALQDADIPASAAPAGEHAYHVIGTATGIATVAGVTRVSLTWTVTNARGDELGRNIDSFVVDSASWISGNRAKTRRLRETNSL